MNSKVGFNKEELAMTVLRLAVMISVVALTAMGQQNSPQQRPVAPASCPVWVPPAVPFTPPAPYELESENIFWLGKEKLWTALRKSEVWYWAPHAPGHEREVQPLTAKTFWGSVDFNWRTEWRPKLKVTGKRLDGDAPPLLTLPTTNAFPGPAAAMLVGVYVPTPGCWEITGDYKGQKLSFVVWLQPVSQETQDLVLVGTVTRIYPAPTIHSRRNWAVVTHVDRVISGEFSGTTFTFMVHSPAQMGLRVGRAYTIKAVRSDGGYLVDDTRRLKPVASRTKTLQRGFQPKSV